MDEGVPLWQVLVVTAASGLVSGVIVALVQGWHERSERLRDLRTQAATGLVTAVLES
jgi:hypothetical protein